MPSSAGVYGTEIDLSLYIETQSDFAIGVVAPFTKGPTNVATVVANLSELESTFGQPMSDQTGCQGFFAVRQYLGQGNQAWVVRANSSANPTTNAGTALRGGSDQSIFAAINGATSSSSPYTLTSSGNNFTTLGILVGDYVQLTNSTDAGWYQITAVGTTTITVGVAWPAGSNTSVHFTIWNNRKDMAADGATSLPSVQQLTSATGNFTALNILVGDMVYITSGSDAGFYGVQTVTSSTILTLDRPFPVGSGSSLAYIIYGRLQPQLTDGSTASAGKFTSATAEFAIHNVQAGDLLVINDPTQTGNNGTYLITGLTTGSTATSLNVNVPAWAGGSLTSLQYHIRPGSVTFTADSAGSWANGYTLVTAQNYVTPTNFDLVIYDDNGYLAERIFGNNLTNIVANMAANSVNFTAAVSPSRVGPSVIYTASCEGGTDGLTGIVDADIIGTGSNGMQQFISTEAIQIDALLVPGYTSEVMGDAMIVMAGTTRADCVAIVDPPDFPTIETPQQIVNWSLGTGALGRTTAFNSSYGALYWPWVQIYDPYYAVNRWIAPSGIAAAVWAQSQNATKPWYAPAGFRRGKIPNALAVRYSPVQGDRDLMQGQACVNPIVNFVGKGIVVFGQKTLLNTTSSLNRVNVRRMMLDAERSVLSATQDIVFEPNDTATDRDFVRLVTPFLQYIEDNQGLQDFLVNPATTALMRQSNQMLFQIFMQPTTAAEIIQINFILTSQTANFQELLAS